MVAMLDMPSFAQISNSAVRLLGRRGGQDWAKESEKLTPKLLPHAEFWMDFLENQRIWKRHVHVVTLVILVVHYLSEHTYHSSSRTMLNI